MDDYLRLRTSHDLLDNDALGTNDNTHSVVWTVDEELYIFLGHLGCRGRRCHLCGCRWSQRRCLLDVGGVRSGAILDPTIGLNWRGFGLSSDSSRASDLCDTDETSPESTATSRFFLLLLLLCGYDIMGLVCVCTYIRI